MPETIALVDYGAGNLHSVHNALKKAGATVEVTSDPDVVRAADRIVLPGVGSFKACAMGLRSVSGMVAALEERVLVAALRSLASVLVCNCSRRVGLSTARRRASVGLKARCI